MASGCLAASTVGKEPKDLPHLIGMSEYDDTAAAAPRPASQPARCVTEDGPPNGEQASPHATSPCADQLTAPPADAAADAAPLDKHTSPVGESLAMATQQQQNPAVGAQPDRGGHSTTVIASDAGARAVTAKSAPPPHEPDLGATFLEPRSATPSLKQQYEAAAAAAAASSSASAGATAGGLVVGGRSGSSEVDGFGADFLQSIGDQDLALNLGLPPPSPESAAATAAAAAAGELSGVEGDVGDTHTHKGIAMMIGESELDEPAAVHDIWEGEARGVAHDDEGHGAGVAGGHGASFDPIHDETVRFQNLGLATPPRRHARPAPLTRPPPTCPPTHAPRCYQGDALAMAHAFQADSDIMLGGGRDLMMGLANQGRHPLIIQIP